MRLLRANGRVIRVGHRGAARLAPENTLRSFEAALEHGVDAIEFDVLDAGPGPLVLGHSLAELGPELATLDDALDFFAGRDVALHVDLKLTTRLDELAAALDRHGVADRAVVSSFHLPSLQAIAAHAPHASDRLHLSRGPVRGLEAPRAEARDPAGHARTPARGRDADPRDDRACRCGRADAPAPVVSPAAVERAHAAGVPVWRGPSTTPPTRRVDRGRSRRSDHERSAHTSLATLAP